MWQKIIDYSVYILVRTFVALVQAVPLEFCERGAELLATLFGRVLRVRGHVVNENLQIAFPNLSDAERDK
ncbi:MAG TPA: lipid A biosynthesis acyltransferase, partial [Lacipirellulaceae bacterium]